MKFYANTFYESMATEELKYFAIRMKLSDLSAKSKLKSAFELKWIVASNRIKFLSAVTFPLESWKKEKPSAIVMPSYCQLWFHLETARATGELEEFLKTFFSLDPLLWKAKKTLNIFIKNFTRISGLFLVYFRFENFRGFVFLFGFHAPEKLNLKSISTEAEINKHKNDCLSSRGSGFGGVHNLLVFV